MSVNKQTQPKFQLTSTKSVHNIVSSPPGLETKSLYASLSNPQSYITVKQTGDVRDDTPLQLLQLKQGKREGLSMSLPPSIQLTPTVSHTYRFVATANTLVFASAQSIAGACGGVGDTSGVLFTPWASSMKIHTVKIWPGVSTSGSPFGCDVSWIAGLEIPIDDSKNRSIPNGITTTGAVVFSPPNGTLADKWFPVSEGSTDVFSIMSNVGSIVDVHVSFKLSNIINAGSLVVTSASANTVYYLALDGPTGNVYQPIGLPTTH